jgi:hypothetical protein
MLIYLTAPTLFPSWLSAEFDRYFSTGWPKAYHLLFCCMFLVLILILVVLLKLQPVLCAQLLLERHLNLLVLFWFWLGSTLLLQSYVQRPSLLSYSLSLIIIQH